jgi:S-DNA-T family DNA segregation ATPase FtsK/SpoIIIE
MTALVDVAATGRQPGVHLILATQSPSGVVDDKIWANSQFRLCLRVANREESHSILRRAEAARLPGRPPGRALLQVGGDPDAPLERLQVASAGFAVRGVEDQGLEERFEIVEVLGDGTRELLYPQAGDRAVEPEGQSELQQLVYLSDKAARALRIPLPLPGPWLPQLPEALPLETLWAEVPARRRFGRSGWTAVAAVQRLTFPFGRTDRPTTRQQPVCVVDLGRQHPNLWLAGRPGAGVDLAVRSLVMALAEQHTPDELELYALAFSGGALLPFKDLPHTAGYYTLRDEAGLRALLTALQSEVDRRRGLFAAVGVDNAEHYRQKTGATLTSILVVIDGFDVLYREAQLANFDSVLAEFKDRIEGLLRAGCDLHLVLTTVTATLFRDGIEKNVTGRIALQLQDRADYFGVLGAPPPFQIDEARGRALWREGAEIVELQLAAPTSAETPAAETEALIAHVSDMARAWSSGVSRRVTALERATAGAEAKPGVIATTNDASTPAGPQATQTTARGKRPGGLNVSAAPYTPMVVPDLSTLPADDLSWLPVGVERIAFANGADGERNAVEVEPLRRPRPAADAPKEL